MNRPKKEFIPTSLSDLNIDSISLGSNGDRHNNNSNGARFNNLDRSKATSSFNLASRPTSSFHHNNNNSGNFSRASKQYGSQSSLNLAVPKSQSVNSFNVNSPIAVDRWEQAWEDNNNVYRPPSYQQKPREHSLEKPNQSYKHPHQPFDFKRSNSINQNQTTSNRSMNHYVDDPFDDPWSGILLSAILLLSCSCTNCTHATHQLSSLLHGDGNKMNQQHEKIFFYFLFVLPSTLMQFQCPIILFVLHHQTFFKLFCCRHKWLALLLRFTLFHLISIYSEADNFQPDPDEPESDGERHQQLQQQLSEPDERLSTLRCALRLRGGESWRTFV